MFRIALQFLAAVLLAVSFSIPAFASAQTAPLPSPAPKPAATGLLLVPFQEPGSTDPHAAAVTTDIASALAASGIKAVVGTPMNHLRAVADAAQLCSTNQTVGILIPDGRYEQTMKRFAVTFFLTILRYPTHAALRLDEVSCSGRVASTAVATGDAAPSGVDSVGNLGAAVDSAFRMAVKRVVRKFVAAGISTTASQPQDIPSPSANIASTADAHSYLVLPFGQPGIADPRASEITKAFVKRLKGRGFTVTLAPRTDDLRAIAGAARLCATYNVNGIVVPTIRVEQSEDTGSSFASLRLALVGCTGAIRRESEAHARIGSLLIVNFGAKAVAVAERSMKPAIAKLFASPSPSTAPTGSAP